MRHALLIDIRPERPEGIVVVRDVNRRAFEQDQEANSVDALRSRRAALLSLVAIVNDRVVSHIMYRPASIGAILGAVRGPMAVLPEWQRQA